MGYNLDWLYGRKHTEPKPQDAAEIDLSLNLSGTVLEVRVGNASATIDLADAIREAVAAFRKTPAQKKSK